MSGVETIVTRLSVSCETESHSVDAPEATRTEPLRGFSALASWRIEYNTYRPSLRSRHAHTGRVRGPVEADQPPQLSQRVDR
jgi:hypothetical protein